MKAYITCPVSHTKERLNLLPEIEKIVREKGIDTFVFQIGGEPDEIFRRDYSQLKSCDMIIAEVSERSHGVGIEIGLSFCLGLERILLHQKGTYVTPLAHGMPKTTIIEYGHLEDLKKKLSSVLNKYCSQK
ncbi:MAG: nucleoside 2-deoxyribosyltransferase [Nanoarchaeota archaeon]|nr:nucleoside 2-deoxyribosyltransferase [Nanoarchaeota archaeon]